MYSLPAVGQPLFFLRHGETDYNRQNIIQGRHIDASLNERGKRQSRAFFEAYRSIPFQAIFVSTLKRTLETVEPFQKHLKIPVIALPGLDEMDWGELEGKPMEGEVKTQVQYYIQRWKQGAVDVAPPGGESPLQVQQRATSALKQVLTQFPNAPLLICTHSRLLRILFCSLLRYPLSAMQCFPSHNAALHIIARLPKNLFYVHRYNDTTHLLLCE